MANEQIPLTVARRHLGSILGEVRTGAHIELAEHGHPVAALIPINDYRSLITIRDNLTREQQ